MILITKVYYASAFYSQQSAEKILKAICIKQFNELIKVHDLVFLAKKVDAPQNIVENCKILSKVYIQSRYPGDVTASEAIGKGDAEEYLTIAKEVY